jgi:hypothetical protein
MPSATRTCGEIIARKSARMNTSVPAVLPSVYVFAPAFSWLREHRPNVPVIVATGYPIDLQREPYDAAIRAVVSKPYEASEILDVLARLVPPADSNQP